MIASFFSQMWRALRSLGLSGNKSQLATIATGIALVVALAGITAPARSQANAVDAAVEGYVHDGNGGALASAPVTLVNVSTKVEHKATTDDQGYYRFPLVPIGPYELSISTPGFETYRQQGINLSVGQTARLNATLKIGSENQTLSVTADDPMIDVSSGASGSVLSHKEVEDLPTVTRNIFNLLLLAPGVIGLPSTGFGTTNLDFGGTERTQWDLDGLDNTQKGSNRQLRMLIVTPEAVEQTQTLANGYSAEFGRAAGGHVNVILKSGTNAFHGSALYQYRPYSLQARPKLSAFNPPVRTWNDEAFSLGGPIKKDKLFFFAEYERNPYFNPGAITITASNAAALGIPASQLNYAPFGEKYQSLVGKVTYNAGTKNTGYIRYNRFSNHQPVSSGGLAIASTGTSFDDHMNGGGFQLATAFSSKLLNEVRVGGAERDQLNLTDPSINQPNGAVINISGVASIGYNPGLTQQTNERSLDLIDNITYTRGSSTWKAGTDIERTSFVRVAPVTRSFTFGGLPAALPSRPAVSSLNQYLDVLAGAIDPATNQPYTYTQLTENGGNPDFNVNFNFLNFFAQDELRLSSKLLMNLGVRYETILFPSFNAKAPYALSRKVNNDYSDFAPRVSINYSPDQKTAISAAYGLYYDIPSLSIFYSAAQTDGVTFLSYSIAGNAPGAPVFPNAGSITSIAVASKANINAFDPNFHDTYQIQANLQVKRELAANYLLTLGYLYSAQRHGLYTAQTNNNAPDFLLADGRPHFAAGAKPNPQFNQINTIFTGANTNFNGLFVNFEHRMSHGFEFVVNYTLSHALANGLGEGGTIEDPTNLHRDYGNADDDARHNLTLQGILEPHFRGRGLRWINGFELTSTYFYNSGMPVNPVAGQDLNGDGVLNDRPLFVARNSVHGPRLSSDDAQFMRNFIFHDRYHATLMISAENAFNSTNAACATVSGCTGVVVNTATAADFGRITGARTARNVQFGGKFSF